MATHRGILAWEIPWTEEPGGLQSMEVQRVYMTERLSSCVHTHTHTHTHTAEKFLVETNIVLTGDGSYFIVCFTLNP